MGYSVESRQGYLMFAHFIEALCWLHLWLIPVLFLLYVIQVARERIEAQEATTKAA